MNVAILNCDQIKPEFEQAYGQYPKMFKSLFNKIDQEIIFSEFDVMHGEYPQDLNSIDLFIITGSRADAYADIPWINDLKAFINKLNAEKKNLFGVCFGHQIIAQALGGKVAKAESGWHVGVDQLQVIEMPPTAKLIGTCGSNCPNAAFTIGKHIVALQGHIEFSKSFAKDLLEMRKEILGNEKYSRAMNSLVKDTDEVLLTQAVVNFLS
ncbi:MAG: hypothetical protein EBW94_01125 [Proteobacteria bacterium]|nr:hypothetical protein [Pseudomonadota bacterium]